MSKISLIILMFFSLQLHAQIRDAAVYRGNQLYAKGQFKEAAEAYSSALQNKKNKETQYNLGNSLYQQKDFAAANKQYEAVARNATDKGLRSISNHNIGNSFLEQKKWDEAINYFKQALRENPSSSESRYNLAYAQAMKRNSEKQQQDKNNKQQNKDKQDQQKDQQDKKNQDKKDQDKDQQTKNNNNQQKDQEDRDNKDQQKNDQGNDKQEKGDQKPQPMPSKLTEKQADQILNALNQEEKKLRDKKEKGRGQAVKLEKDW